MKKRKSETLEGADPLPLIPESCHKFPPATRICQSIRSDKDCFSFVAQCYRILSGITTETSLKII